MFGSGIAGRLEILNGLRMFFVKLGDCEVRVCLRKLSERTSQKPLLALTGPVRPLFTRIDKRLQVSWAFDYVSRFWIG